MMVVERKGEEEADGFKMDVKLISKNDEEGKLSFILEKSSSSFVNALRHFIMDRVPTMAIEDVEFRRNNSILYDEIIAHRLGLVPLKTDLKSYNLKKKCKCNGKGCAQCQLKLTLNAKGPCIVDSSKLKSKDKNVEPVHAMPIVKLLKDQQIQLEATAVLGEGQEHAKWSPGLVFFRNKVNITINEKCDGCEACVKKCPKYIFETKNRKAIVIKERVNSCHICKACIEACPNDAIKIEEYKDSFIFNIESWGQLNCNEIVKTATDIFEEDLDELGKQLKKLK